MTSAAPPRRVPHRWHAPEKGSGPAFALSILAHAVLFIAIAFMVRWKSEPVAAVSAELWTLPPAAVQQPTVPLPPRPVQVEPPPPPPPEPRKAEIVIEQKKAPTPKVEPKPVSPPDAPKKQAADLKRAADEKREAELKKAAEQKTEAERIAAQKAALNRVLAQAGPSSASSAGAGLSNAYSAQVRGCIRPHIIFDVPTGTQAGQYVARFEVTLLPTGEQAGAPRLLKSSGLPAYDVAVERAIRRCDPFPMPKEGRVPSPLPLIFDPVDQ